MCSPRVMATVQEAMSRRRFLGRVGAAGAAAALGTAPPGAAGSAQEAATPVANPMATPQALASPVATGGFSRVQDLSHVITPAFPVFPGFRSLQVTNQAAVEADGFYANDVAFAEHTGTHMDAPAHFVAGGATAERLPADRLVAPLVVIDIGERAAGDPDAQLTPDDVLAWEARYGPLPAGAFVAMHSGWETRLVEPARYFNADAAGALHFPGVHPDTATLLVGERDIVGLGVDTLSLDFGAATSFDTHLAVLGAGKYGLENVAGLAAVPPSGATIVVGGPKHEGASGGPTRAFALF